MQCNSSFSFVLMNTAVFNLGVQRFERRCTLSPSLMRIPLVWGLEKKSLNIHLVRNSLSGTFSQKQKSHYLYEDLVYLDELWKCLPILQLWDHRSVVKVECMSIFHIPMAQPRQCVDRKSPSGQAHVTHELEVVWDSERLLSWIRHFLPSDSVGVKTKYLFTSRSSNK